MPLKSELIFPKISEHLEKVDPKDVTVKGVLQYQITQDGAIVKSVCKLISSRPILSHRER